MLFAYKRYEPFHLQIHIAITAFPLCVWQSFSVCVLIMRMYQNREDGDLERKFNYRFHPDLIWYVVYNILISYCIMHTEEGDINYCLFEELQFHDTQKGLYRHITFFPRSLLHKLALTAKLYLFEFSCNIIFSSD